MSIGRVENIATVSAESQKIERESGRAGSNSRIFRDLLVAATGGTISEDGKKAAKAAEILQLEMMRSAINLDGSAAASASVNPGGVNSLLAAYGIDARKKEVTQETAEITESAAATPASPAAPVTQSIQPREASPGISSIISRASRRYGVDEGLIKAVIQVESNFKPTAVSPVGARGLMQLMPATAAGLGVTDSFDPEQNVMAGTRFLKDMLNRYGGNVDKALAAYNWGPGNLEKGKGRLPRETQDYLVKVKKLYADNQTA